MPSGGVDPKAEAGKEPGEDLDHESKTIAFVSLFSPKRRHGGKIVWVGGRIALLVQNPALRDLFSPVLGQVYLTVGYGAGGHVDKNPAFPVAGERNGNRIGTETGDASAEGRHGFGRASGIRRNLAYHALLGKGARIISQPADMRLLEYADRRDIVLPGLLYRHLDSLGGDHISKAPVAVDSRRRWGFGQDLYLRTGLQLPFPDPVHVGNRLNNAVGVMAHQVGADEMIGNDLRLVRRRADSLKDMIGNPVQILMAEYWHLYLL